MHFVHHHHDQGETVRIFEGHGSVPGAMISEVFVERRHPVVEAALRAIAEIIGRLEREGL